jgi:hypothetical protein
MVSAFKAFLLFYLAAVVQLFTKFQPFYATEDSLPGLQVPTTGPYPDPHETSPHKYIISVTSILILSLRIGFGFLRDLFIPEFPSKILCALLICVSISLIADRITCCCLRLETHFTTY